MPPSACDYKEYRRLMEGFVTGQVHSIQLRKGTRYRLSSNRQVTISTADGFEDISSRRCAQGTKRGGCEQ